MSLADINVQSGIAKTATERWMKNSDWDITHTHRRATGRRNSLKFEQTCLCETFPFRGTTTKMCQTCKSSMWHVDCEIDLVAMMQRHRKGSDTDQCEARLDDHPQSTLGKPPMREGDEEQFAEDLPDLVAIIFAGDEERFFGQILPFSKTFFSSCGGSTLRRCQHTCSTRHKMSNQHKRKTGVQTKRQRAEPSILRQTEANTYRSAA